MAKKTINTIITENTDIKISTLFQIDDAKTITHKGLITVNTTKPALKVFPQMPSLSSPFESIMSGMQELLVKFNDLSTKTRQELILEMIKAAKSIGANAVIGVRFETNTITENAFEWIAYGTAVYYTK